jgi:hypothetical protein
MPPANGLQIGTPSELYGLDVFSDALSVFRRKLLQPVPHRLSSHVRAEEDRRNSLALFLPSSTAGTLFTGDLDFTPPHNCTINGTQRQANVQEIVPQLQTKAMAFKAMRGGFSPPRTLSLQQLPGFARRTGPSTALRAGLASVPTRIPTQGPGPAWRWLPSGSRRCWRRLQGCRASRIFRPFRSSSGGWRS